MNEDSSWIQMKKQNLTKLLLCSSLRHIIRFFFFFFKQMHISDAHRAVGASVTSSVCVIYLKKPADCNFSVQVFLQWWQPVLEESGGGVCGEVGGVSLVALATMVDVSTTNPLLSPSRMCQSVPGQYGDPGAPCRSAMCCWGFVLAAGWELFPLTPLPPQLPSSLPPQTPPSLHPPQLVLQLTSSSSSQLFLLFVFLLQQSVPCFTH